MTPSRRELQTARRRCHPGSESLAATPGRQRSVTVSELPGTPPIRRRRVSRASLRGTGSRRQASSCCGPGAAGASRRAGPSETRRRSIESFSHKWCHTSLPPPMAVTVGIEDLALKFKLT